MRYMCVLDSNKKQYYKTERKWVKFFIQKTRNFIINSLNNIKQKSFKGEKETLVIRKS